MIVHPQYSRCLSQNYVVKAHEDKPNRNYKQLDNINLILPSNFLFKKFKKIVGKRTSYSDLSVIACGRHCGTSSSAFKLEFYPTKLNMQMTLRSFLAVLDVFTSISVKTTTLFWQWIQQTSATAQVFFPRMAFGFYSGFHRKWLKSGCFCCVVYVLNTKNSNITLMSVYLPVFLFFLLKTAQKDRRKKEIFRRFERYRLQPPLRQFNFQVGILLSLSHKIEHANEIKVIFACNRFVHINFSQNDDVILAVSPTNFGYSTCCFFPTMFGF